MDSDDFKPGRAAALDRLARGKGALSDAQRAAWAKRLASCTRNPCRGRLQPGRRASRTALKLAMDRAALSQIVYDETVRTLGGQMALVIISPQVPRDRLIMVRVVNRRSRHSCGVIREAIPQLRFLCHSFLNCGCAAACENIIVAPPRQHHLRQKGGTKGRKKGSQN